MLGVYKFALSHLIKLIKKDGKDAWLVCSTDAALIARSGSGNYIKTTGHSTGRLVEILSCRLEESATCCLLM